MSKPKIIIIGAGVVGQLMAIQLHNYGLSPILIGPQPVKLPPMVYAIHPYNLAYLQDLNIQPECAHVSTMEIATPNQSLLVQASSANKDNLCHIIKHDTLIKHTQQQVLQKKIEWHQETPISYKDKCISLHKKDIVADLFIACDGKESWMRKHTSIPVQQLEYEQYAHIATISHSMKNNAAFQRFDETGTLAFLPLQNQHQSALIWSCSHSLHQKIIKHGIKNQLKTHAPVRLEPIQIKNHTFIPLTGILASKYHQNEIILAGNALHTIHPLAGIGLNLGIGDIRALSKTLIKNNDIGQYYYDRHNVHTKAHWLTHSMAQPEITSIMDLVLGTRIVKANIRRYIEEMDRICF